MHRHLPPLIARYTMQVTLIALCGCLWNVAAERPRGIAQVGEAKKTAVDSRPRQGRSVPQDIGHLPALFSTTGVDRKDDDEPEEDMNVYGFPLELADWEPEADDSEASEQLANGGSDVDKRKWGDNKARVWGKRKWGDNRARVWGKRLAGQIHRPAVATAVDGEQRAAEANFLNKLQAENRKLLGEALSERSGKRKWGENKARIWGK